LAEIGQKRRAGDHQDDGAKRREAGIVPGRPEQADEGRWGSSEEAPVDMKGISRSFRLSQAAHDAL
jgi:hypothetical protein